MRPVLKRARFLATLLGVPLVVLLGPANLSATPDALRKLDPALTTRARQSDGFSRIIVRTGTATSGKARDALIREAGGMSGRKLPSTSSQVAVVPNAALRGLAASPIVERVSKEDRRRALDAGFQLHLAKPIDGESLVTAVAKLARLDRR